MSAYLSPIAGAGWQFLTNAGAVLNGGKLYTYTAGSTALKATWTDSTQGVLNANPIVLDSYGRPPNEVWLASGSNNYKFVLTDSTGNILGTWDNITGIAASNSQQSEWVASGLTPTYVSATQFTVVGDQTLLFPVYRRVQYVVAGGTYYGYVSVVAFGAATTVTIVADSTGLDATLSSVSYGFINSSNTSIPQQYVLAASQANPTPGSNANKLIHVNAAANGYEVLTSSTPVSSTMSFDSTHGINDSKTTVVSATAPDIWTNTGHLIDYTGTATATGFAAAPQAGASRVLLCAGAAVFTAGANMLIDGYQSGSSVTCAANDRVVVVAKTTTQFVLVRLPAAGYVVKSGDSLTGPLNTLRATVASAATTADIWSALGNEIDFTGIATVTNFPAAPQAGAHRILHCAGACTFTQNANIAVQGAVTYVATAGDIVHIHAITTTTFKAFVQKTNGYPTVIPPLARSPRTSNTILAVVDYGNLIDSTSGTYSQTLTAAATLGSWYAYVGVSSTAGYVTLDPNGAETITVNGVAQSTWVLWPNEMGLLICNGTGFYYYCIQKGEVTQTLSGNVASVSFSTGLAYRRRMVLSITNYSIATTNSYPYLQVNTTDSTRFNQLLMVTNAASGNSTGGVLPFELLATLATGAAAADRMVGNIAINADPVVISAQSNMRGVNSGSNGVLTLTNGHWTGVSESTITSITILQSSTGVIATGTFVLREI